MRRLVSPSRWIFAAEAARIFEVASLRTARKILDRAGTLSRQLPGLPRQYDRAEVEKLARESIGAAPAEAAVA